jgi:hypothetical protein
VRFQVTTVVLLAVMGGASLKAAEKAAVDVYMCDRDGSPLLLGRGMALASALFDRIGVRLHWRTGELPAGQNALGIRTVEHAPESATAGALASTHLLGAFGTEVTVYGDRMRRLFDDRPSLREVAAAYVLAHELAHAMQGVARHSESGIMKAQWSRDDYQEMVFHKLRFSATDVALIHFGLSPQSPAMNLAER